MASRFDSLLQLTLVRLREGYREPEVLFWIFAFPILMAAGLGIAFRRRPPDIVTIGIRGDVGAAGGLPQALTRGQKMRVFVLDSAGAHRALQTGKISLLVVPRDDGQIIFRYDPTREDALVARALANDRLQRMAGREDPLPTGDELIEEKGSRYIDFLIPGLLGMNLMASGVWGIGFAIVDTRRKKLLKRLIATPMRRWEFLASFILSRLLLLVLEVAVIMSFGMWVFDVPMRGSWFALAAISILGALTFGGVGLLAGARPQTIEGASGVMNIVMLPMWVFSGIFFASNRFPDAMQPFIQLLPLTAANDALRAVILEGAALATQAHELVILAAWLVVTFIVALKVFRWS